MIEIGKTADDVLLQLLKKTGLDRKPLNYHDPAWQAISKRVKRRDGFRCRQCGSSGLLDVHHITPLRVGGTNNPANLKTLCRRCHGLRHHELKKVKYVSR